MVHDQVHPRPGSQGCQALEERDRLEAEVRRAVVPLGLESATSTRPSGWSVRRSCATGGRSTYRQSGSSRRRSSAAMATSAWRSNPSSCACRGPADITQGACGPRPTWRTRAPACGPRAIRPCTAALLVGGMVLPAGHDRRDEDRRGPDPYRHPPALSQRPRRKGRPPGHGGRQPRPPRRAMDGPHPSSPPWRGGPGRRVVPPSPLGEGGDRDRCVRDQSST